MVQLRVLKERFNEDGSPMVDPQSGEARRQLVNGGCVRVIEPKTQKPYNYLPGETFELPAAQARDLILNAPQSVELEATHQARLAKRTRQDAAREDERNALDARIRDLDAQVEQAKKLRAMAEERERTLAAENLRAASVSDGKTAQIQTLRAELEEKESLLGRLEAMLQKVQNQAQATIEDIEKRAFARVTELEKQLADRLARPLEPASKDEGDRRLAKTPPTAPVPSAPRPQAPVPAPPPTPADEPADGDTDETKQAPRKRKP